MGQVIDRLAKAHQCKVVAAIHPNAPEPSLRAINAESVGDADVCIDFTNPEVLLDNVTVVAGLGKSIVIGTSGWYDRVDTVRNIVEKAKVGAIYAHNFSIGMNLFFMVLEDAARRVNIFPDYDVAAVEYHHNQKVDSPSGTAVAIGEVLLKQFDGKERVCYDKLDRKIDPDELHIASVRCGSIPGTHSVMFDSGSDTITLTHTAHTRDGWALGALRAAHWINERQGLFTIGDMLYHARP